MINENWFHEIDIPEKAFYLGFAFADGSVILPEQSTHYGFQLTVKADDRQVLDDFAELINVKKPEVKSQLDKRSGKTYDYVRITVCSRQMLYDVTVHGLIRPKEKSIKPIGISDELLPSFISGLWEADGGFCKRLSGRCSAYLTGYKPLLSFVQQIVNAGHIYKHGSVWQLVFNSKTDLRRLYNLLEDTPAHILRKRVKFKEWLLI